MKKLIYCTLLGSLLLTSCMKTDFPSQDELSKERISKNVENVFGTTFDANHTWCTTVSSDLTITNIPSGTKEVQLLVNVKEDDGETSIMVLNKANVNGAKEIKLSYDLPSENLGLYVAYISDNGCNIEKVGNTTRAAMARAISTEYTLPSTEPTISIIEDSYSSIRGWIPSEKLYQMAEYGSQKISVADYDQNYKEIFRTIIFSYFKNGRKYNNLPLVQECGFYNADSYPLTTGEDPIIISLVYKNDGGYQEVVNSDLYYFYFKESEMGADPVSFLEHLPKYKAIQFNECIKADDEICKHAAYALVYWGDGVPTEGTKGSYQFPKGYKIGFMVRAKTTAEGGKKQGELYGDGRLNNHINFYGNFKSSKLGTDGPRMAWIGVNGKMLLCCESGTDTDFNDIILEIEGGVEPIIPIPVIEENVYTFCFEDTELGDYDLNDIVIKAKRLSETQVEYSIVACGANDNLIVMNIGDNSNKEVHQLFGSNGGFINTVRGQNYEPVVGVVTVNKSFSFLDENTQPYIVDKTTNHTVKISKKGEDPHGIMIPYDFRYPLERVCVKNAYSKFNNWGENQVLSTDWYKSPNEDYVF